MSGRSACHAPLTPVRVTQQQARARIPRGARARLVETGAGAVERRVRPPRASFIEVKRRHGGGWGKRRKIKIEGEMHAAALPA